MRVVVSDRAVYCQFVENIMDTEGQQFGFQPFGGIDFNYNILGFLFVFSIPCCLWGRSGIS